MKPIRTAEDEQLIAQFSELTDRLDRLIRNGGPRRTVERAADDLIAQIELLSSAYLTTELSRHFKRGSNYAIEDLAKVAKEVDTSFSDIHTELVQQQANQLQESYATAIGGVRRNVKTAIGAGVTAAILSALRGGNSDTNVDVRSINIGGRNWNLEHYLSMATYTASAQTQNLGAAVRYMQNDVKYFRRIERASAPDRLCQWARNKIFSFDMTEFIGALHPNCFGGIEPVQKQTGEVISSFDQVPNDVQKLIRKFN